MHDVNIDSYCNDHKMVTGYEELPWPFGGNGV